MGRSKSKSHEEFAKEVFRLVGNEYTILGKYTRSHDKILMKHNTCNHEWEVQAKSFLLGGSRCPNCYGKMKKTTETFKKEIFDLEGNDYKVLGKYKDSKTKILIKHNLCGHEWMIKPNNFLNGRRCNYCFGKHKKTTEQFRKEVFDLYGDEYTVLGEYINGKTKIKIKHNLCGFEWLIMPFDFLRGSKCLRCSGRMKKTTSQFKDEVFNLVSNEYTILEEYKGVNTKILFRHNLCNHEWMARPGNFLHNKTRCPICYTYSKGESDVTKYLIRNNIDFKSEFSILSDRKRYDFKVRNILIEFDGIQHFNGVRRGSWSNAISLEKQQEVDRYKTFLALLNGYKLVRISYTEIDNINEILDFIFNNEIEDVNLFGKEYSDLVWT